MSQFFIEPRLTQSEEMTSGTAREFNEIASLSEYEKDLKELIKKRFPTLPEDINNFIKIQLKLFHKLKVDNRGIFRIRDLKIDYPNIYKGKKFACKSLKGKGVRSGIRIIYAYYEDIDKIEFIEIYFKGDKAGEDRERIKRHYKGD